MLCKGSLKANTEKKKEKSAIKLGVGETTVTGWKNSGRILNVDYFSSIAKF